MSSRSESRLWVIVTIFCVTTLAACSYMGYDHYIISAQLQLTPSSKATIENDRISFYYFSRSHSVKAFAFPWLSGEVNQMRILFWLFSNFEYRV